MTDRIPARLCVVCDQRFPPESIGGVGGTGWQPVTGGWSCPSCTREYEARVEGMARSFMAHHPAQRWIGTHEHRLGERCLWCDVIRRAQELALSKPT